MRKKKPLPKETKSNDKKPAPKTMQAKIDESIRVRLSRINDINDMIGELVILQTVLSQRRYVDIEDELSNKSITQMSKIFKDLQEVAMSLRMLPLRPTFQKMTRIVRDTSNTLGKKVNLHIVGEETEIDKTILEGIADPLVHIVRNSIDHGLEMPDVRQERGKSAEGNVELLAYHEGSNLVIQVTDDGNGIDPEVLRKKAIGKNIIRENEKLSDEQLVNLIFHPGFSTKEQVTEVSGRGVGMDVVKTNIEKLGGEVQVQSRLGTGSSFKIILPLTLAIIEGMIVKSSNYTLVVPLGQVHEFISVEGLKITKITGGGNFFQLRGEVLPLFDLSEKLRNKSEIQGEIVIVVRTNRFSFGVLVNDIVNQQQVVIKKLSEEMVDKKGVMGTAILGDGKPSFILDLIDMFSNDLKESRAYQKLRGTHSEVA